MPTLRPDDLLASLAGHQAARRGWVAFSGGLDSTVLLHALVTLRGRLPFELRAVHIDHGLHEDSASWAEHCLGVCTDLDVALSVQTVTARASPGESLEATARAARYHALAELLESEDLLMTAHHQDDQAETLLLALLRGSGVHGLAAMPVVTRLGRGHLLRPLLDYTRDDLRDYAARASLGWLEDPSNARLEHDRNRLRHEVLPVLRRRWPAATRTLSRSAGHCAEAAQIIDQTAADLVSPLAAHGGWALSMTGLKRLSPERSRAALRYWLRLRRLPIPSQGLLQRIFTEVIEARDDAEPLVSWDGGEVRRYRERLFAHASLPQRPGAGLTLEWTEPELALPHGLGRLARWIRQGSAAADTSNWLVRFGVAGARWRPRPGAPHRPLKKLFQECGIPPWLRPYVPLVFAGDDLLAVAGVAGGFEMADIKGRVTWDGHPWTGSGIFD